MGPLKERRSAASLRARRGFDLAHFQPMKTQSSVFLRSALFALLVVSAPLSMSASQEELAKAMADAQANIRQTGNQLQLTIQSLTALAEQKTGDLKPTFAAFATNLAQTEADAKAAAERATAMAAAAKTYFDTWQNDINTISNPDLKARAVKRMTNAQKNYDKLTAAVKATAEQYKPLLSDLQDIKVTLASDLTADGIKAVKGIASRAARRMQSLHAETNDLLEIIAEIRASIESKAG